MVLVGERIEVKGDSVGTGWEGSREILGWSRGKKGRGGVRVRKVGT